MEGVSIMMRFAGVLAAAVLLMGCQQGDANAQLTENERDEVRCKRPVRVHPPVVSRWGMRSMP